MPICVVLPPAPSPKHIPTQERVLLRIQHNYRLAMFALVNAVAKSAGLPTLKEISDEAFMDAEKLLGEEALCLALDIALQDFDFEYEIASRDIDGITAVLAIAWFGRKPPEQLIELTFNKMYESIVHAMAAKEQQQASQRDPEEVVNDIITKMMS